ncbi:MAG: nucleotidyl transferase AbiEii/AbiGii toxin family protein, partial [Raoultibacter sp.]
MTKQPHSLRHLDDAIRRLGNGSMGEYVKLRTLMANAIVAQMLPDGVIKGGSAIKMRFGNANTRFTTDLDTATSTDLEAYASEIALRLKAGWEGFSGIIVSKDPAHPEGVPQEYVMQPFDVKLSYRGKPWCTVPLEVGHNEIGDADDADWIELKDAARAFSEMGFPELEKVPLMSLPHQIAQKIHAVSGGGDRARDLIDLQLIFASTNVELAEVKNVCIRLFRYRDKQSWPPIVTKGENWDLLYASQSEIFSVKPGVDEAI